MRPTPSIELSLERLELPDGDFIDLGWCAGSERPSKKPLAVLLHGLTGGFDAKYARGLALQLMPLGWRCVILQFRGAGPEPNRLPRSYHHGETDDLRMLLELLREREPATRLAAVGWSLGGNVLLKYLGESGAATPLSAAVAVCAPFQLKPCAERLRTGFSRIYQRRLLRDLKELISRKHATINMQIDIERVLAAQDFFDFDNAATAILNGYRDAEDYYARASCGQYLPGITIPTLIIHAQDDPFMVPEVVPDAAHLAPSVTLELCEHGGHVGFVEAGPALIPRFWLEHRIPEFLQVAAMGRSHT